MLSVKFSNKSAKFIKKLQSQDKERIREKINELKVKPFPKNCVRIERYKDYKVFRVRVGNLRILYSVFIEENLLMIIDVDKRSRVY